MSLPSVRFFRRVSHSVKGSAKNAVFLHFSNENSTERHNSLTAYRLHRKCRQLVHIGAFEFQRSMNIAI